MPMATPQVHLTLIPPSAPQALETTLVLSIRRQGTTLWLGLRDVTTDKPLIPGPHSIQLLALSLVRPPVPCLLQVYVSSCPHSSEFSTPFLLWHMTQNVYHCILTISTKLASFETSLWAGLAIPSAFGILHHQMLINTTALLVKEAGW